MLCPETTFALDIRLLFFPFVLLPLSGIVRRGAFDFTSALGYLPVYFCPSPQFYIRKMTRELGD